MGLGIGRCLVAAHVEALVADDVRVLAWLGLGSGSGLGLGLGRLGLGPGLGLGLGLG